MTRSSKAFAVQLLVSKIADDATFSPDGKSLLSAGELLSAVDGSKLWQRNSRRSAPRLHQKEMMSAALGGAVPIRPFLANRAFEPGMIVAVSAALERTCKALGLKFGDDPSQG